VIFHEGLSCEEYDQNNDEDTICKYVKKCPECLILLEKAGGCSHYKCICGHEFCWKCVAPYDPIRKNGNHYHKQDCKFYRAVENLILDPSDKMFNPDPFPIPFEFDEERDAYSFIQ